MDSSSEREGDRCLNRERQRRYRTRRRKDRLVVRVELGRDEVDALVSAKLLPAWDDGNRAAIGAALREAVTRLLPRDDA